MTHHVGAAPIFDNSFATRAQNAHAPSELVPRSRMPIPDRPSHPTTSVRRACPARMPMTRGSVAGRKLPNDNRNTTRLKHRWNRYASRRSWTKASRNASSVRTAGSGLCRSRSSMGRRLLPDCRWHMIMTHLCRSIRQRLRCSGCRIRSAPAPRWRSRIAICDPR